MAYFGLVGGAAKLVGISASYVQSGSVYINTSLDDLKADLTVTATYDNGQTLTVTSYTLSGLLEIGTSTITVTYNGKTDTFDVTVSDNGVYIANWDFSRNAPYIDSINDYRLTTDNYVQETVDNITCMKMGNEDTKYLKLPDVLLFNYHEGYDALCYELNYKEIISYDASDYYSNTLFALRGDNTGLNTDTPYHLKLSRSGGGAAGYNYSWQVVGSQTHDIGSELDFFDDSTIKVLISRTNEKASDNDPLINISTYKDDVLLNSYLYRLSYYKMMVNPISELGNSTRTNLNTLPCYLKGLKVKAYNGNRTLLYDWDFTKSMYDRKDNKLADGSNIVLTSQGVSNETLHGYLRLFNLGDLTNKTIEIDVSSVTKDNTYPTSWLFATTSDSYLSYNNTNGWKATRDNAPQSKTYSSEQTSFSNCTIKFVFTTDHVVITIDDVLFYEGGTFNSAYNTYNAFFINNSSQPYGMFTVTGARVYQNL